MRISVILVALIILAGIGLFVAETLVQPDVTVVREQITVTPVRQ